MLGRSVTACELHNQVLDFTVQIRQPNAEQAVRSALTEAHNHYFQAC